MESGKEAFYGGTIRLSGERVNVLKDRAGAFLDLAKELFGRGRMDLAFFHVEQACQLRIKATILRFTGEIPRIHSIRELLSIIAKRLEEIGYSQESNMIVDFVREYRETLIDVEDAYIESKYNVSTLTKNVLSKAVDVAEMLFKLLERIEGNVLG